MANIIISYRRSDSAAIAGRIRDRLAEYYGADAVFMDIDSIPFGIDFRQQIQEVVTKKHIMFVQAARRCRCARGAGPEKPQRSRDIGRTAQRRISLIFLRANNNNGTGCFACFVCWMDLRWSGRSSNEREPDARSERVVPWVDRNSCRVRCFCGELHEPGTTLLADLLVSYLRHTRSGQF